MAESFAQPILSNHQLTKLKEHKYASINNAFLDPYMNHFWLWLVQRVPAWIHPNTLTVGGLVVNALTTLILIYYSPDAKTPAPTWTYFLCGLGIFIYQTLDALDGKHARRTNTSSPLGELFDHGCDALSTMLVTVGVCVTVNLGTDIWWLCFYAFSAEAVFYLAHWQTYVTGTLQFGKFDVTELQFACIFCHLLSTVGGAEFWTAPLPVVNVMPQTFTIWFMVIGVLGSVFLKASIILKGGPGRNGSAVGNMSILSPLFPLAFVLYSAYYVFTRSPETVAEHPLLFVFAFGVVMSKITDRLVIAHMTQNEMKLLDSAYIVPLVMMGRIYWGAFLWIPDHIFLWALLLHASVDIAVYCVRTCTQIRDHLNIRVFSMSPVPSTAAQNRNNAWNQSPSKRGGGGIPARINVGGSSRATPSSPLSARAPIQR
ncbi:Choline/ethanolaminephosphotransferase 1 [Hypsibius exemplaris]|uniref:diacylglycerol cholinephosphotransferase n=1 Tax=Hypsibius exemplaris TaxID=2072580 RepID=A0A1W0X2L8_HYPEX|nr:Choline/ethanolaminephosphotransferase 1 [Hypsibius exemplaris]